MHTFVTHLALERRMPASTQSRAKATLLSYEQLLLVALQRLTPQASGSRA